MRNVCTVCCTISLPSIDIQLGEPHQTGKAHLVPQRHAGDTALFCNAQCHFPLVAVSQIETDKAHDGAITITSCSLPLKASSLDSRVTSFSKMLRPRMTSRPCSSGARLRSKRVRMSFSQA